MIQDGFTMIACWLTEIGTRIEKGKQQKKEMIKTCLRIEAN